MKANDMYSPLAVLLLLLIILLGSWCLRKRRHKLRAQEAAALAAAATAPPMKEKETATVPLLAQQHPNTLMPGSGTATSPTDSDTVPDNLYFSESTGRRGTQEMRNVPPRINDTTPLPNPYDGDTPPQPPPHNDEVISSPTSPVSGAAVSRYTSYQGSTTSSNRYSRAPSAWTQDESAAALLTRGGRHASYSGSESHSSNRRSSAPSAWTHDESAVALLSRGDTQTSRHTASSSLTEELAGYQKALEAHHRKEEEEAVVRESRVGEGSAVPSDPPPVYSLSQ